MYSHNENSDHNPSPYRPRNIKNVGSAVGLVAAAVGLVAAEKNKADRHSKFILAGWMSIQLETNKTDRDHPYNLKTLKCPAKPQISQYHVHFYVSYWGQVWILHFLAFCSACNMTTIQLATVHKHEQLELLAEYSNFIIPHI